MKKIFLFRLSLGLLGMGVLFCADRSVADKESTRHVKLGKLDFELEKICTLHDGSNQYRIVGERVRTITADTDKDEDLQKHVRRKITQCFLRNNSFTYVPYAQQKGDIDGRLWCV